MAQTYQAYPQFQQVAAQQQRFVEVPQEMASVFDELFKNDKYLTEGIQMVQRTSAENNRLIRNDMGVLIREFDRVRSELQMLSAEVRGQKPAQSVLPPMGPVLPQQGDSATYQSIFNQQRG